MKDNTAAASFLETEVAEALLDVGVSVPLKDIQVPFRKKPLRIKLVMKRPTLGAQIRLSRLKSKIGMSYEDMRQMTSDQQQEFIAIHGRTMSRMIALMVCRGYFSGLIFAPLLAWVIRWWMAPLYMEAVCSRFISLLGTKSFGNIIRCMEMANPLAPTLSQKRKRS